MSSGQSPVSRDAYVSLRRKYHNDHVQCAHVQAEEFFGASPSRIPDTVPTMNRAAERRRPSLPDRSIMPRATEARSQGRGTTRGLVSFPMRAWKRVAHDAAENVVTCQAGKRVGVHGCTFPRFPPKIRNPEHIQAIELARTEGVHHGDLRQRREI